MLATIVTIVAVIAGAIVLLCLVVLFSPFVLRTEFAVSSQALQGSLTVSWLHPFVAAIRYSTLDGRGEVRLFGWRLREFDRSRNGTSAPRPDAPSPAPSTPQTPTSTASETVSRQDAPPPASASPSAASSAAGSDSTVGAATNASRRDEGTGTVTTRFARFRNSFAAGWRKFETTWRVIRRHRMTSRIARWFLRLLVSVFRITRFDLFRLSVRAGIQDPAALGRVYGWYAAAYHSIRSSGKKVDIGFEPLFMQNRLAFDGAIGLRTNVARMVAPLVAALFTFPWLRAFFVWRGLRKLYRPTGEHGTIG